MPSFVDYLPERIRRPMYGENDWPYDPLNMAIMLACFYVIVPLIFLMSFLFATTDLDEPLPVWLDPALTIFMLVLGWIALDEWRSRRRSTDEVGHGWIWQMVHCFGPRRRLNQVMLVLLLLAIVGARGVTYVDRFAAADLEAARALFIVEAAILMPVATWMIG